MLDNIKAGIVRAARWVGAFAASHGIIAALAPTVAASWWETHRSGYWYVAAAPLLAALSKAAREQWPNVPALRWLPF